MMTFNPMVTAVFYHGNVAVPFYGNEDIPIISAMISLMCPVTSAGGVRRILRFRCIWRRALCARTTDGLSDIKKNMVCFMDESVGRIKYALTNIDEVMKGIGSLKRYMMGEQR